MARALILSLLSCLVLVVVVTAIGVPRPGRFFGALNRGRENLLRREFEHFYRTGKSARAGTAEPPELWYDGQSVDHFNPVDTRTFSQRFFVNDTYWKPGGPVFLLLGGEGPIHSTDVTGHFAFSQQAASFNAMSISLEHRFYGKSIPLGSTQTDNLKYLTADQALADYANFIQWFTSKNVTLQSSKWVAFGGSYSGNLSAWMRLRYPHLIVGAIASSGPVLAQTDFPEYLVTVSQSLGSSCSDQFAKASVQIDQMLSDPTGAGVQNLQTLFKTCDPIVSELDKTTFVSTITDEVAGIVQYNNDNNNYESTNIPGLCATMASSQYPSPVNAWAAFINNANAYSNQTCTPVSYQKQVREMQITKGVNSAGRCWYWQTCTQYGYYQTAESTDQPFSPRITLDYFLGMCNDVYGSALKPNTDAVNTAYGATNLQSSRIVLSQGTIDPWHTLGVLARPNALEITILINGTAHVADLYPRRAADLPQLSQARTTEMNAIAQWLKLPA